jgi:hypothetical protein
MQNPAVSVASGRAPLALLLDSRHSERAVFAKNPSSISLEAEPEDAVR